MKLLTLHCLNAVDRRDCFNDKIESSLLFFVISTILVHRALVFLSCCFNTLSHVKLFPYNRFQWEGKKLNVRLITLLKSRSGRELH